VSEQDLNAIFLTLKLAGLSTIILLLVGTPIAWWLSRSKFKYKFLVEAFLTLPLVLPPTVLGFYLLLALSPVGLAFSFTGLVIGSVVYSLPFVVGPLQDTFVSLGNRPLEVAATLRAKPMDQFFSIVLPLSRSGFITGGVLGFAHTLGEFGVVLMIGGNIPGVSQVLSISIYDHVESMNYQEAHVLAAGLMGLSLLMLIIVYFVNKRFKVVKL
tara:strand:- start:27014 stop:27652 length:639 start_codon:yes stop_codon:yes gene_type:complete